MTLALTACRSHSPSRCPSPLTARHRDDRRAPTHPWARSAPGPAPTRRARRRRVRAGRGTTESDVSHARPSHPPHLPHVRRTHGPPERHLLALRHRVGERAPATPDAARHLRRSAQRLRSPGHGALGKRGWSRLIDDDAIRALVTRLARPHAAGGQVIERAAILAAGADTAAVLAWVTAHSGEPEELPAPTSRPGLHSARASEGGRRAASRTPRRYVFPPGALT